MKERCEKMMSHTPGPWRVDSSMVHTGWVLVTTSDGNIIANVNTETGPDIPPAVSTKMPAMNNATLIAAAPEMLEALEAMVEMVEMNGLGKRYALDLAASAIRKARGVDEASVPDCIKRLSRSGEMEVQK